MTGLIVLAATMAYVLIGGLIGYAQYYAAVSRCDYRYCGASACLHEPLAFFAGLLWPVIGPILLGREIVRTLPELSERRHSAKMDKVRRARKLAEEQLKIAQLDAERKRVEARGVDDRLRDLGLLERMGENPFDRS